MRVNKRFYTREPQKGKFAEGVTTDVMNRSSRLVDGRHQSIEPFVQLRVFSGEDGELNIDMTHEEAASLINQLSGARNETSASVTG